MSTSPTQAPSLGEIHEDLLELVAAPTSPALVTEILRVFDKLGKALQAGAERQPIEEMLEVVVNIHDQVMAEVRAEVLAKRTERRQQLRENNERAHLHHKHPRVPLRKSSFRVERDLARATGATHPLLAA